MTHSDQKYSLLLNRVFQYVAIISVLAVLGGGYWYWKNAQAGVTQQAASKDSLVGYWSFDEGTGTQAGDASGNANTGTLTNGPTWVNGKLGKAINFDGVNDIVNAGSASSLDDMGARTLSAWIYPESMGESSKGRIFNKAATITPTLGWILYIANSEGNYQLSFIQDGSTDLTRRSVPNSIVPNTWQHLLLTWDGSTTAANVHIYVDGTEVGYQVTTNGASLTSDAAQDLLIGNSADGTRTFDGYIDEPRIYDRALSSTEIADLYALGAAKLNTSQNSSLTDGLVGEWSFNGPDVSGTTAYDRSGSGNNGTLTNGPAATIGRVGQALSFDGTDDHVSATNVGNIKTISYWIKTDNQTNGGIELNDDQYIEDNAIPEGLLNPSVYIDGVLQSSLVGSELVVNGEFASNITGWTTTGTSSIAWQNAASGDGSTGYLQYTIASNASWDRFRSSTSVASASSSYQVSFWYRTSGITGNMRAFFTDNFSTLGNSVYGPYITPSTSWKYVSFIITTTSSSYPIFGIHKSASIGAGTFDVDAISVKKFSTRYPITDTNWHHVVITTDTAASASAVKIGKGGTKYMDGSLDEVRGYNRALSAAEISDLYQLGNPDKINAPQNDQQTGGLVGLWSFNGPDLSGTTAYDRSGSGNNGTLTNGPTATIGKMGQALSFDGADDSVDIPNIVWTPTAFSVSFWLKPNTCVDYNQMIGAVNGWGAFIFHTTSDCSVYAGIDVGLSQRLTPTELGAGTVTIGSWNHYIFTFESGVGSFYKNGSFLASKSGLPNPTAWGGFKIGSSLSANTINGQIDETRIYNRALSTAEISALYDLGR